MLGTQKFAHASCGESLRRELAQDGAGIACAESFVSSGGSRSREGCTATLWSVKRHDLGKCLWASATPLTPQDKKFRGLGTRRFLAAEPAQGACPTEDGSGLSSREKACFLWSPPQAKASLREERQAGKQGPTNKCLPQMSVRSSTCSPHVALRCLHVTLRHGDIRAC